MLVRVQVPLSAPIFKGSPVWGPFFFTLRNSIRGTNRPSLFPRSIAARARARFAVQIAPLSACHTGEAVGEKGVAICEVRGDPLLSRTVASMDAGVEPPGMGSRRVRESSGLP